MIDEASINLQISKIKNLPPLPETSIRIINAVNNPEISVEELVDVISFSPVLTARLLGLANSAFFGRRGKIDDLRVAIIQVLGLNLVKSLTLSIVLNVELDVSACQAFDSDYYWSHALTNALIAQKLAVSVDGLNLAPNIVYTSGLLLNIGLLAAIFAFPDLMAEVFSESDPISDSISKQMKEQIGKSQYELGGMLLEGWKLPAIYTNTVKYFSHVDYQGEEITLISLLRLSHLLGTHVVCNEHQNLPDFADLTRSLLLKEKTVNKVLKEIVEEKENIKELATIICG